MISAIILNYKTNLLTKACCESLLKHKEITEIIIVNNGAKDKELELLADSKITILNTNSNLGYAKGNNQGVLYAKNDSNSFILIVNSDIIVPQTFSFKNLITAYNTENKIGIISPSIINTHNGKNQAAYNKENIYWSLMEVLIPPLYFLRKNIEKIKFKNPGYVYRTMGSFMLTKKKLFFEINLFDENTFLGSEEEILAEKLKKLQKKFYHYPQEFVLHSHGATRNKASREFINNEFLKSKLYYQKQYLKSNKLRLRIISMTFKLKNSLTNLTWK